MVVPRRRNRLVWLSLVSVFLAACIVRRLVIDHAATTFECTAEEMNGRHLSQDDPCVLQQIRRHFLVPPPARTVAYAMEHNTAPDGDPSDGQAAHVLGLLNNRTGGFFVECGALDGDWLSNTLYMERSLNWTGILIEANPYDVQVLVSRRRKSWIVPVCLSIEPYATKVNFQVGVENRLGIDYDFAGRIDAPGSLALDLIHLKDGGGELTSVQCFPLYSILLAVGQTRVDYFSLDVEGHELAVLKTVPWHRVDIKTLSVEWEHIAEGKRALVDYMESNGYVTDPGPKRDQTTGRFQDVFFVKKNDLK